MSRDDPQMKIRLPAELKHSVERAAFAQARTLNAEIVARLRGSFEQGAGLPDDLETLVQIFAVEHELGYDEALREVVLAGTSPGRSQVLRLALSPGLTAEDLARAFDEARKHVPGAYVVVEREAVEEPSRFRKAPPTPLGDVQKGKADFDAKLTAGKADLDAKLTAGKVPPPPPPAAPAKRRLNLSRKS